MFENLKIILASGSPRRKQLLEQAEVSFKVRKAEVEEDCPNNIPIEAVPEFLAEKKAVATQNICSEDKLILAADTIVLLENKIMGKPVDRAEAIQMITNLSGQDHKVITGVCLLQGNVKKTFSACTKVCFKKLSKAQIEHYVDQYQPMDKAGAYGIQEWIGLIGIERIEGDYFNVVGLPVSQVTAELGKFKS